MRANEPKQGERKNQRYVHQTKRSGQGDDIHGAVLFLAVGAALLIRVLGLTPNLGMWVLWSITPTAAAVIMLLVVTREGYSREG